MFDSPILEVAIGLSYVFLILSLIATILVEGVSDWRQWRGRMLYAQVCKLLGPELAYEFYSDNKVVSLASGESSGFAVPDERVSPDEEATPGKRSSQDNTEGVWWWANLATLIGNALGGLKAWFKGLPTNLYQVRSKLFGSKLGKKYLSIMPEITTAEAEMVAQSIKAKRLPSYIPDSVFADVIIGWLRDESTGRLLAPCSASKDGKLLPVSPELIKLWNGMYQSADGNPVGMRQSLVEWFKSCTDRMGGDYRRRVRYGLLIVGVLLVVLSNADAIYISNKLYQDPQVRTQLVEAATQLQELCATDPQKCADPKNKVPPALRGSISKGLDLSKDALLGGNAQFCDAGDNGCTFKSVSLHIFGWLLTILAIGLGTDFWFGTIQKLLSIGNAKKAALTQGGSQTDETASAASGVAVQPPPRQLDLGSLDLYAQAASGMKGFSGRLFCESPLNAFWLGQLASLAYSEPQTLTGSKLLAHLGINDPPGFIQDGGTQAYLFQHNEFAVVAFRGTEKSLDDFLTDADFKLQLCGQDWYATKQGVEIHAGFAKALDLVWSELEPALAACKTPIWFTGHSLGGALAVLAAYRFFNASKSDAGNRPEIGGVYTYGQPRVGNQAFKEDFPARIAERMYRFVDDTDIVPQVPPPLAVEGQRYQHVGQMRYFDAIGQLHTHPDLWDRLKSTAEGLLGIFMSSSAADRRKALQDQLRAPLANHAMAKYVQALERNPSVRAQWAQQR